MERRFKLRYFLIAGCIGFLSTSIASHYSGVRSTGSDAHVVSVRTGDDANQCMGLQETTWPTYYQSRKDFIKQKIEEYVLNITDILEFEEGFRAEPYQCSEGFVTIGLGTKLHKDPGLNPDDFPITVTRKQAEDWLSREVQKCWDGLSRSIHAATFTLLDDARKTIVLSMCYQMGVSGVLNFRNMWKALGKGDYDTAAKEMLDSRWAKQTPARAKRHSKVMKSGDFDGIYGS